MRSRRLAILFLLWGGCSQDDGPAAVPEVKPQEGLAFAYVDVASAMGVTLRNRSGRDGQKNFITEAMPPGVAVADFDGDGWMDVYMPNGNDVARYDRKTKQVTLLTGVEAPRNALYWNEKGERFREGAAEAGVDDTSWSFGAVAGDIDHDGDPDLYVCNWGANRLYLNRGDGTFEEAGERTGAAGDPRDWSTGSCFVDYDRDGDLDIYVAQYADVYAILEDRAITNVSEDGRVDGRNCDWKGLKVYCGPTGLRPLNDFLLKNLLVETGELRFQDVSAAAGIVLEYTDNSDTEHSQGPYYGFQPVAWDIDHDGWQDVFVANDMVANLCWMNKGDGTFEDRAHVLGLALSMDDFVTQASMGVGLGDVDQDGEQDLAISVFSDDQFNLLLAERLPTGMVVFNEMAAKTGLREMTFKKLGWGTQLFDPDHDGDLDIFFACGHVFPEVDQFKGQETTYRQYNLLVLNEDPKRPKLVDVSAKAGPGLQVRKCSRASAVIDFDNDGDPDLVTTELNDTPCLLRCDLDRESAPRHWLQVRLRGNPAAKVPLDPAGAEVTVTAGGLKTTRIFLIGSSFLSSEDPRMHFGLGDAATAHIEVLWPNGEKTRLENVKADQLVTIAYPRGE